MVKYLKFAMKCGKNGVEVKSERCGGRELQKYQKRGTKIVKSAQIDNF